MKIFIAFLCILLQILTGAMYSFDGVDLCVLVVNCIFTVVFFYRIRKWQDVFWGLVYLMCILLSIHLYALLEWIPISGLLKQSLQPEIFYNSSRFGNYCLLFYFVSYLLGGSIKVVTPKVNFQYSNLKTPIPERIIWMIIIFEYILTLTCLILGIGTMGKESRTVLPFHLNGIFYMFRVDVAPIFFMIYVFDSIIKKKRIKGTIAIAILGWLLLEVVVRLSKASLLLFTLPTFIMLFYEHRLNKNIIVKYGFPVLFAFIAMYPIIENLRNYSSVDRASILSASNEAEEEGDNKLRAIMDRTFSTSNHYYDCYPYFSRDNTLFCFDRALPIIAMGGSEKYKTYIVDGYPMGVPHSSGTTGIMDPLLIGGKGLAFVVIMLLSFWASLVDHKRNKNTLIVSFVFIYLYYRMSFFINISWLVNGELLIRTLTFVLCWWLIKKYQRLYLISCE